jgi:hypothetical protein
LLSLRHSYRALDFCIIRQAENLPIKWRFSRVATVLEIAELQIFSSEKAFFSKASYYDILVQFRKVKGQSDNLQRESLRVRIPPG